MHPLDVLPSCWQDAEKPVEEGRMQGNTERRPRQIKSIRERANSAQRRGRPLQVLLFSFLLKSILCPPAREARLVHYERRRLRDYVAHMQALHTLKNSRNPRDSFSTCH